MQFFGSLALFIKQFDKAKAEIHKIEQSKARQARLEKIKQEASPSKSKNLAKKVVGGNNLNFNLNQKKAVRKKLDGGAGGVEVGAFSKEVGWVEHRRRCLHFVQGPSWAHSNRHQDWLVHLRMA